MQRIELSKGIHFNQLSDASRTGGVRVCTITSSLSHAAPDWRIAYLGFERWSDATRFVFRLKEELTGLREFGVMETHPALRGHTQWSGRYKVFALRSRLFG